MRLKKTSRYAHSTLNITPLLDLVFVLLVIFIITTPQLMNNLEMILPSGKPPERIPNQPKQQIHKLVLDAEGQAFLNNEPFSLAALREKLKQLKSADSDLRVVVKADDEVDYQSMVSVLDTLQQLEITKVGLATGPTVFDQ